MRAYNRARNTRSRLRHIMDSNLDDLKSPGFWRGVVAEGVGTLLLVFIGCGACLKGFDPHPPPTIIEISFTFGLTVATLVWIFSHVSGGHINPAVTIGMLIARRISLARAILYIFAQCGGAVIGAALLAGLTPHTLRGSLGATGLSEHVGAGRGFVIELLITGVLVLTVFASTDNKRSDLKGSAPLTIGLAITTCHLFAIKYTSASMNPARSFGPALIMNQWHNHWVYWCGPILGSILAAISYETLLAANASLHKTKAYLLTSSYDPTSFDHSTHDPQGRTRGGGIVKSPSTATEEQVDESLITTIRVDKKSIEF